MSTLQLKPEDLGQLLARRRKAAGHSRRSAARALGIPETTYRRLEAGGGLRVVSEYVRALAVFGAELYIRPFPRRQP